MKTVFHFDINGTITAIDSTEPFDDNEGTNSYISRSIYGKVIDNIWTMNEDSYDEIHSIPYYYHLKQTNEDYKILSTKFTEENHPGHKFNDLCKQLQEKNNFFFDSFINFISTYPNAKIIFKTFGNDRNYVLDELQKHNFDKTFIDGRMEGTTLIIDDNRYDTPEKINDVLLNNDDYYIIKEDYKHWSGNQRDKNYGKMLVHSDNHIQYFFDDNDCVYNIGPSTNNKIFVINSLKARLDKDYFLNLIK